MPKHPRRPRDPNLLARDVFFEAIGEKPKADPDAGKDAAAVARGKLGGVKGGRARAAKMTAEERSAAAKRAANTRWSRGN